jgi:hypothetical protein
MKENVPRVLDILKVPNPHFLTSSCYWHLQGTQLQ